MSQVTEAMIEAGCRAVYEDWPHKAFSQALMEATGKPLNAVLTYAEAKSLGMTEDGLRKMLKAAFPAMLQAAPESAFAAARIEKLEAALRERDSLLCDARSWLDLSGDDWEPLHIRERITALTSTREGLTGGEA